MSLPDSTSPNPEIIVKMMKALVKIQTASPGPSMVSLPRGLVVGSSLLVNGTEDPLKSDEFVTMIADADLFPS